MENLIDELGELALGSRLKRLSDTIMREGKKLYTTSNIDFEPSWFPVFYLLSRHAPLGVTEIAEILDVSHPTVINSLRELVKHGLVETMSDENDKRKRLSRLTVKGEGMIPEMQALWNDIAKAFDDLLGRQTHHLLRALEETEQALREKSFYEQVRAITRERQQQEVQIVSYQSAYAPYFKSLNMEWLEAYFQVEAIDERVLSDPQQYIIDVGGEILFAKYRGEIVGTCALLPRGDRYLELTKMAVTAAARGKQVGKRLGQAAVAKAVSMGCSVLMLESNTKLKAAINLYRFLGFKEANRPFEQSEYQRSNIYMEMKIEQ